MRNCPGVVLRRRKVIRNVRGLQARYTWRRWPVGEPGEDRTERLVKLPSRNPLSWSATGTQGVAF